MTKEDRERATRFRFRVHLESFIASLADPFVGAVDAGLKALLVRTGKLGACVAETLKSHCLINE